MMENFFACGFVFLIYAIRKFFKNKILYPSIVFSAMWGIACVYTGAILNGYGENLMLKEYYEYQYMDSYIVLFTIASLLGFMLAHLFTGRNNKKVNLAMSNTFMDNILEKYKWVMWLNFYGGLLRIVAVIITFGFNSFGDYRLAANALMMSSTFSFVGIVFRLTAYTQMLANVYLALYGLKTGFGQLDMKKMVGMFILFAPTQMATGGRLFVLYFILYFFGSFILARGLKIREDGGRLFERSERRIIVYATAFFFFVVAAIPMLRSGGVREDNESALEKFAYITEGALSTEQLMQVIPPESVQPEYGMASFGNFSDQHKEYLSFLLGTKNSAGVKAFLVPLYLDFGYYGSVVALFFLAFLIEYFAIRCLNWLTVIRLCVFVLLLKMVYESVISPIISINFPQIELIIIFAIFYRSLFGNLKADDVEYEESDE
ncbi:oligosaccharide repeat unit polymerase [Bacteroides finegoldii]|uniref:oligosaccharide repeat unit polymerase n=1 Tax=Bacteroides finegoldii TaxID=338188 RepID=UPI00189B50B7|nr:oligosaccharide repeat unit polymerase [Bacteroides finegoldii]